MNHPSRSIAGLDLSLTSTGIATRHPSGTIETHRIRSTGKKTDTWQQRANRLTTLNHTITSQILHNTLVILEAPSYGSTTGSQHDRSGLWWLIHQQLTQNGCQIIPVTPSQRMKYAVGKGGGQGTDKDNILAATIRRYPNINITGNDIADATILLAIGCRLTGNPIDTNLPKTHLDTLTKLQLPEDYPTTSATSHGGSRAREVAL